VAVWALPRWVRKGWIGLVCLWISMGLWSAYFQARLLGESCSCPYGAQHQCYLWWQIVHGWNDKVGAVFDSFITYICPQDSSYLLWCLWLSSYWLLLWSLPTSSLSLKSSLHSHHCLTQNFCSCQWLPTTQGMPGHSFEMVKLEYRGPTHKDLLPRSGRGSLGACILISSLLALICHQAWEPKLHLPRR
jgi:hypothetical protein